MPASSRNESVEVASKSLFCAVIDDLVYLSHGDHKLPPPTDAYRLFQPQKTLRYYPICDDFGPMNLAATTRFVELLEDEIYDFPDSKIVLAADPGRRSLANAAFLLGAFMILRLRASAADAARRLSFLDGLVVLSFHAKIY
jgi:hypothetical protein